MKENFRRSARKFCSIAGTFRNVLFPSRTIVVIFYKFTFVEFLVRQKIACHERIHLKFTKRIQL